MQVIPLDLGNKIIIEQGDTLNKIASELGVTLEELVNQNKDKIKDPNLIFANEELYFNPEQELSEYKKKFYDELLARLVKSGIPEVDAIKIADSVVSTIPDSSDGTVNGYLSKEDMRATLEAENEAIAAYKQSQNGNTDTFNYNGDDGTESTFNYSKEELRSSIVDTARQYLDSPYLWGGTSPSGFDCSGFTQYVFGENGVDLNRLAYDQRENCTQISPNEVKAGDLMIWKEHVALCTGEGTIIYSGSHGVTEIPIPIGNEAGYGNGAFVGYFRPNALADD